MYLVRICIGLLFFFFIKSSGPVEAQTGKRMVLENPKLRLVLDYDHGVRITDLVVNGLDLLTVAQISGTSVAMIEKHYGHLQADRAAAALAMLAL